MLSRLQVNLLDRLPTTARPVIPTAATTGMLLGRKFLWDVVSPFTFTFTGPTTIAIITLPRDETARLDIQFLPRV